MSGMPRADRRDSNSDNKRNNPHPQQIEAITYAELKQKLISAKADNYLLEKEKAQLQEQLQMSQVAVERWKEYEIQHQLFLGERQKYQQILFLYNEEQAKYEEADAQREKYLLLYNKAQTQLKSERSSKASIKGWETRRKRENERLKQQIGDMVILLRESLERKEESINHLYLIGDRMDRIQSLMTSAELDSNQDPVGDLEKLMRVWLLVQKILAE